MARKSFSKGDVRVLCFLAASNSPRIRLDISKGTGLSYSTVCDSIGKLLSKQLVWSSGVRGTKKRNYRERFELTESGLYVALRENWQGLEGRLDFIALKYGPVVKNFPYLGHWQHYVQTGRRDEVIGFLRYLLSSMEPKELGEGDSIHLLSGLLRPSGQLQNDRMVKEFSELTEKDPNVQREVKEVRRVLKRAVSAV